MKRHTPLLAAALATVALSTAPGCSLVLVKPPPQPLPQDRWVACTEYVLWPVIDIAYAALAASPIVFIAASDGDYRDVGLILGTPLFLAGAALFGYSSYEGFSSTARCREAHRTYEHRREASPP